jgi:hypothetical protein
LDNETWLRRYGTTTTFDPTGYEKCRDAQLAGSPSGLTFFESGASEGGKAGEGGVACDGSGLATGFATFTAFGWPSWKKCRLQTQVTY